jgi:hypothetical protein
MYLTILVLIASLTTTLAAPSKRIVDSCRDEGTDETVCAEIYPQSDCKGPRLVVTGAGCHDKITEGEGSIHVVRGQVLAGYRSKNCTGSPDVLAGPMWRVGDQGCENYETVNGKDVRSWNAF